MSEIERMKAELEANGYEVDESGDTWQAPDQFTYFIGWEPRESLETAYAHLQERRELEALRETRMTFVNFLSTLLTMGCNEHEIATAKAYLEGYTTDDESDSE